MSDTGNNTTSSTAKRTPKVGVYVPRHRRGNETPSESETSSTSSSRQQSQSSFNSRSNHDNRRPQRNNSGYREDSTDDSSSSRSGNNTSGEVHRRGRGKFMGPGSSNNSNANPSSEGSGYYRDSRNNHHHGSGYNNNNNSSSSSSVSNQQSSAQPPRQPRGRDFDATVLRKYSDDENRPGSSFSRSNTYGSGRSNNNSNTANSSGTHSPSSRSSGRNNNNGPTSKNSSRKSSPKRGGDGGDETSANVKGDECTESTISALVEKMQLQENNNQKSEGESSEELEEWEIAFQDSNESTIPKAEAPKSSKSSKPHPAEHLLESPTSKTLKAGISEATIDDDTFILELYDFSPTIKTMHLTDIFSPYENKSGGFRIKWVDDSKALVIFESAAIAKLAYNANVDNQIVKMRPYTGTDKDSIRKTTSASFNGARPAKTDTVARRLVQGALGLRVKRTPEQIAEEKALVQAAKEAREIQRQEQQKQRQELDAMFNS